MSNVNDVAKQICEMGYNVETNVEYMDSMKKQMAVIQAVLGGIGASDCCSNRNCKYDDDVHI